MIVTSVTVGYGRTYSLRNYNNVKPSITLTVEVSKMEDVRNVIERVEAAAREYVENAIDDALFHDGQSPAFYDGPLYSVYHWVQRDIVVLLSATFRMRDLPGKWNLYAKCSRVRYDDADGYATERAFTEDCEYVDLGVSEMQAITEIDRWWNARVWYRPWTLVTWPDRYREKLGQILVVPEDLTKPDGLISLNRLRKVDDWEKDRDDLLAEMAEFDGVEVIVVDDQELLDAHVATWVAEHPKPGDDIARDQDPDDDYEDAYDNLQDF